MAGEQGRMALSESGHGKGENMKAHVIENGKVVNTIVVDSLDFMPNLVEATEGGIGWSYADGVFTPPDPVSVPVTLDVLETDAWTIPADGTTFATVTYTNDTTTYSSVNEITYAIEPVEQVATLEITADAPGPIRVEVKEKQLIITALEVTP
jgi:hypothetical protein